MSWVLIGCSPDTSQGAVAAAQAASAEQPSAAQSACGRSGLPDCPLQNWMKSTLQAYQRAHDYERLARSLAELSEHGPEGYDDWQEMAQDGMHAAQNKDETGLRHACTQCHQTHRARYRRERRNAAVW